MLFKGSWSNQDGASPACDSRRDACAPYRLYGRPELRAANNCGTRRPHNFIKEELHTF